MTAAPQHEWEVLAARNMRAAANGTPAGWLTPAEATEALIVETISMAAGSAERTFLATAWLPFRSRHANADWIERVTLDHIADMLAQAHQAADMLDATPEQRHRLEVRSAERFDFRLAFLRAFAVMPWGTA